MENQNHKIRNKKFKRLPFKFSGISNTFYLVNAGKGRSRLSMSLRLAISQAV
jgi:hypothetical protein